MPNGDVAAALAEALQPVADEVGQNLVVEPWFILKIAAPTIDIYPADPFTTGLGFGYDRQQYWVIRARIHTIEHLGAQSVLLQLMEPWGDTSVIEALIADQTLNGNVQSVGDVEGPTGYTEIIDIVNSTRYLGVTWRVTVITLEPS